MNTYNIGQSVYEPRDRMTHKFVWLLSANHRCVLWPDDQWECSIFVALNQIYSLDPIDQLLSFIWTSCRQWTLLYLYDHSVVYHQRSTEKSCPKLYIYKSYHVYQQFIILCLSGLQASQHWWIIISMINILWGSFN